MHARTARLAGRLAALEQTVPSETLAAYRGLLDRVEQMRLGLYDAPGAGPVRPCVADVEALVARRRPHLPTVDHRALDQRLRARRRGTKLDRMRGEYANRSGVQKALDRDVRRMLLG